jgi:glycosyltransferase involved in cell wall biosynthesis
MDESRVRNLPFFTHSPQKGLSLKVGSSPSLWSAFQRNLEEFRIRTALRRDCRLNGTVAVGLAWRAANTGGLRKHIESVERYSCLKVSLFPSSASCIQVASPTARRRYQQLLTERAYVDRIATRHRIIHSHVDPAFIQAGLEGKRCGKPWVHTYHTLYFQEDYCEPLLPWQLEVNRALIDDARQADVRLSVSPWLSEYLEEMHGIATEVIPNGVDVAACDMAIEQIRSEATQIGAGTVLFVGSIDRIKNPAMFIQAAAALPEYHFVMIGTGLTSEIIRQTLGIEIPDNMQAIGPLGHRQVLRAIAACRTLVMTSHREGFPTVLLEAMACEKPCVAPNVFGCRDVVGTDEFGFLYSAGSLDELIAHIRQAMQAKKMPAARERVLAQFDWKVVAGQLDSVYNRLLR